MECTICNLRYDSKNDTLFNISLNNLRKNTKDPKAILPDKHFQKSRHRFKEHARFTIIDRLTKTNLDKEILRQRLIHRENFWIEKLETLYPKELNQELKM